MQPMQVTNDRDLKRQQICIVGSEPFDKMENL